MSVNEATEVYETERLDPARPGGVKVPPFPVYDAPGIPDNVSDVSAVHREVTYARAIGFRPLKMDIWPATAWCRMRRPASWPPRSQKQAWSMRW